MGYGSLERAVDEARLEGFKRGYARALGDLVGIVEAMKSAKEALITASSSARDWCRGCGRAAGEAHEDRCSIVLLDVALAQIERSRR